MKKYYKKLGLAIFLFFIASHCFATPLPIYALLKICENPYPSNVTRVVSNYGWIRDNGRHANGPFGPRWISPRDNMNMNVKATNNGSLVEIRYRLVTNSYAAENLAASLSEYGFSCVNNYKDSQNQTHLVFCNYKYRIEFLVWHDNGNEYDSVLISLR